MYRIFDKILVPMDLSPTSLITYDHAVYLAKKLNSEIHLLHIKETATVTNIFRNIFKKEESHSVKDIHLIESRFAQYAEELKVQGIRCYSKFLEGTVYLQVLNYA